LRPLILLAIGCLLAPGVRQAQTVTAPPLSADEAVQIATRNDPRLAAAAYTVAAARSGTRAADTPTNPELTITPSLTGGGGGSDTELLLRQPLELNGARAARRDLASARQRAAAAQALVALRDVVFETRVAYAELVRVREQAAVTRDLLQISEALDSAAQKQVEAGARPAIEQTQTAIEVTRARQQATRADAAVTAQEAALNAALNRPPDTPIGPVSLLSSATPPTLPSLEEATKAALANRAEIPAGTATADTFRQEARLAQSEGIADFAPQFRATRITHGVQQSGFGLGITVPLLDYGSRRNRVRQAKASAQAEDARTEATRVLVRQEAAQALAHARAADTVLAAFIDPQTGDILSQARHLLDASRLGYEAGKTGISQLLEAQRTYRQIQNEYIDAEVAAALARAELERATGAVPATSFTTLPTAVTRKTR